jgi:head-tail adaptor
MTRGEYRHVVRFELPGVPVPDGDGGYTQGWTPIAPGTWHVSIRPASARDLENETAGTIAAIASHIVTGDYLAGITTQARMVKLDDGRIFQVQGKSNVDERNETMILACIELETVP